MTDIYNHFINGAFDAAHEGQDWLQEYDPRSGDGSFRIARGAPQDVERAVAASRAALRAWRKTDALSRGRILTKMAHAVRANSAALAGIEQRETGKSAAKLQNDMETVARYFEFYGGLAPSVNGETIQSNPDYHMYTLREPFGVVGVITPWNAPMNQAARGIAPALAAGGRYDPHHADRAGR
jgi:aldehyde dehydrogenase (NAD+)